ncbi:MAG: ribose-5-phosphate isomerase RpiA [Pseudomonadota bacterium]
MEGWRDLPRLHMVRASNRGERMVEELPPAGLAKRASAVRALDYVEDGMIVGLGTGSTAKWFVDLLGGSDKRITGVPTSSRTKAQAEGLGIPLTTLDAAGSLDLTIDGADEFDGALNLIKGGGGALLQEKIVASASRQMVVISDPSKEVETLGAFPLPIEIVRFGAESTTRLVRACLNAHGYGGCPIDLRGGDTPFVTDEGHFILDCRLGTITDPAALDVALNTVPGVVETGLFCGIASTVIVGQPDGTARLINPT